MGKGVVKLYQTRRSGGFSNTAKFPAELARLLIEKYGSPVAMTWEEKGGRIILTPSAHNE